jgi:hypothetical protein
VLKRTVTYKNPFTDEDVTEEHYFHLTKADLLAMQMENLNADKVVDPATGQTLEGFRAMLQRVINDRDGTAILQVVKDIIRRSYGKRDGTKFLQSPEIYAEFEASGAYAQLFFELCTDAKLQADFMNGVMPKELLAEAQGVATTNSTAIAAVERAGEELGADMSELKRDVAPREITPEEAAEMDQDELQSGLVTGRLKFKAVATPQ